MPINPETSAQAKRLESLYVYLSTFAEKVDNAILQNPDVATIYPKGCHIKKFEEDTPDDERPAVELEVSRVDLAGGKRVYSAKRKLITVPKCVEDDIAPFEHNLQLGMTYPIEEIEGIKLPNIKALPETISWEQTRVNAPKPRSLGRMAVESTVEITRMSIQFVRSFEGQIGGSATAKKQVVIQRTSLPVNYMDLVNTTKYVEVSETAPEAQTTDKIDPNKIRRDTKTIMDLIQNTTW